MRDIGLTIFNDCVLIHFCSCHCLRYLNNKLMIHLVKPMPVVEQRQGQSFLPPHLTSLSIPAIPVDSSVGKIQAESKSVTQTIPLVCPQAMEAELVRFNNERKSFTPQVPVAIPKPVAQTSAVNQARSGYRPMHLCYEPSSMQPIDLQQEQSWDEKMWRWTWIISLVCAAIAGMVFLVFGYNLL